MANCPNCGASIQHGATRCVKCGTAVEIEPQQVQQPTPPPETYGGVPARDMQPPMQAPAYDASMQKSKIAAGLLGIFLGWLGIHNFYLGYTGKAVVQLLLSIFSPLTFFVSLWVASVWGLVEGILILTGSINTDSKGIPLKD